MCIRDRVNTVLDNCIAQRKNMPSQVINMIRIVDFAVFQRIESAHTCLLYTSLVIPFLLVWWPLLFWFAATARRLDDRGSNKTG